VVARLDAADPWRMAGFHGRAAFALALSPDGAWVASGGADGRVAVWSVSSTPSTPAAAWRAAGGWVTALAWAHGGLVSAADDGTITRWRWPHPGKVTVVDCGLDRLISLAVNGPVFVAGGESGRACHGRLDGSPPPRVWRVSDDPVMGVALSTDRVFTSASAGTVRVWDVTNGALVATLAPTINRSPP
jgi:WD40 repeat protein